MGVLLCFCASAFQSTAPVGLSAGTRQCTLSAHPRFSGSPHLTLPGLPSAPGKVHRLRPPLASGLGSDSSCLQAPPWAPFARQFLPADRLHSRFWTPQ